MHWRHPSSLASTAFTKARNSVHLIKRYFLPCLQCLPPLTRSNFKKLEGEQCSLSFWLNWKLGLVLATLARIFTHRTAHWTTSTAGPLVVIAGCVYICLYIYVYIHLRRQGWKTLFSSDLECKRKIPICISPVPKSCCNIWQTCNYEYIQCNYVSVIKKKLPGVGSAVCPHPKKEASSFKVSSLWPVGWRPACNRCLTTNLRATKNMSTTYHLLYYIISAIFLP